MCFLLKFTAYDAPYVYQIEEDWWFCHFLIWNHLAERSWTRLLRVDVHLRKGNLGFWGAVRFSQFSIIYFSYIFIFNSIQALKNNFYGVYYEFCFPTFTRCVIWFLDNIKLITFVALAGYFSSKLQREQCTIYCKK